VPLTASGAAELAIADGRRTMERGKEEGGLPLIQRDAQIMEITLEDSPEEVEPSIPCFWELTGLRELTPEEEKAIISKIRKERENYQNYVAKYTFERIEKMTLKILDGTPKRKVRFPLTFEEIEKDATECANIELEY